MEGFFGVGGAYGECYVEVEVAEIDRLSADSCLIKPCRIDLQFAFLVANAYFCSRVRQDQHCHEEGEEATDA